MRSLRIVLSLVLATFLSNAHATFEGIPADHSIRGNSRPCCNFVPSPFTNALGLSGFADPEKLGTHDFGSLVRKKKMAAPPGFEREEFGAVYSCRGGFLDLSHVRDNADWAATIYRALLDHLGKGVTIPIRKEGGSEETSLVLPKMNDAQLASFTPEKIRLMAVALAFDLGLFHEIATSFTMAVSGPPIFIIGDYVANERSSAFSIEDGYSNLLGGYLGVAAAASELPYNAAMTKLMSERLADLGVVKPAQTREIHRSIRKDWWRPGIPDSRQVRRRDYTYEGAMAPKLPRGETVDELCGANVEPSTLEIPTVSGIAGLPDQEVAYVRIRADRKFIRKMAKIGAAPDAEGYVTRDQFPKIIPMIHADYRSRIPDLDD